MDERIPLTVKYDVGHHIDKLNKRYGIHADWDKTVSTSDEDFNEILKFREAVEENDHQMAKHRRGNYDVIIKTHYLSIEKDIMTGHTIAYIADWLDLNAIVLRRHIRNDHDLKLLYQLARARRKNEAQQMSRKIRQMLNEGYTYFQISVKLHVDQAKVAYESHKMHEEVSNG